jgi:hypothetical protein
MVDESSLSWTLDAYNNGLQSTTSSPQMTDSIRSMGTLIFQYGEHPEPNEFRLKMENNILLGTINGQQVFERPGALPFACLSQNGVLVCTQGSAGESCSYTYLEGQAEQNSSGCSDLVGKIGVACLNVMSASLAAEQVARFGFGIGWDVTNCEVDVVID